MVFSVSVKARRGLGGQRLRLDGWVLDQSGPISAPAVISLAGGPEPAAELVRLVLDPQPAALRAGASGGSRHYFRLADATLRPLPAEAPLLALARGDAYIALSPGAARLASSPAIVRWLHERDDFNAERLAEGVLSFLAEKSGQIEFPEDVAVVVVEAR